GPSAGRQAAAERREIAEAAGAAWRRGFHARWRRTGTGGRATCGSGARDQGRRGRGPAADCARGGAAVSVSVGLWTALDRVLKRRARKETMFFLRLSGF